MPFLTDFDVITLELPGRGHRIKETLIKDFEEAARDLLDQVFKSLKGLNFIFYGHSLGALLGFRVCQLLEEHNFFPEYIVVSGNAGPGIKLEKNLSDLEGEDFVSELVKLGGIPEAIARDSEAMDFFLPILKSDFAMADNKNIKIEGMINTPIYALMGDKDERANEITNWKNFTKADFQWEILNGNHFFIYEQAERIATVIKLFI